MKNKNKNILQQRHPSDDKHRVHRAGRMLLFMLLLTSSLLGWSQEKLQVVEKKIEKDVAFKPGESIRFLVDKAKVSIIGWDKDYINFSLKFIARHKDLEVAEKELAYMKHRISPDSTQEVKM